MPKKATPIQAKKHLKEILLLFSVPAGIIILITAFLYIPRFFANPAYDFIYCSGYRCENNFSVNPSGTLSMSDDIGRSPYSSANLYYYDVARDATRPIHASEASRYKIDASSKSPDGYSLDRSSGSGGFLLWNSYEDNWSLRKNMAVKPVNLGDSDSKFIGWILQ